MSCYGVCEVHSAPVPEGRVGLGMGRRLKGRLVS